MKINERIVLQPASAFMLNGILHLMLLKLMEYDQSVTTLPNLTSDVTDLIRLCGHDVSVGRLVQLTPAFDRRQQVP